MSFSPEKSKYINGSEYVETARKLAGISPRLRDDFCCNVREKWVTDADGSARLLERIVADRPIFNPSGVERCAEAPAPRRLPRLTREQAQEMTAEEWAELAAYNAYFDEDPKKRLRRLLAELHDDDGTVTAQDRENRERAARRAKRKVSDYVMAEYDFKYFITLTLSGRDFARNDVGTAVKKLNTWLKNRVQRVGLKYIIVPEYHADGESLHFHGFINDALRVSDSGCVVAPGYKKPIKRETARRYGVDLRQCHTVYNLPDWLYGYTTAIELYGDKAAAAAYIAKYITKQYHETDGDRTKIGGRYYWHSNNLREPVCRYENADFESWPGDPFDTPGGQMKIEYFTQKQEVSHE